MKGKRQSRERGERCESLNGQGGNLGDFSNICGTL